MSSPKNSPSKLKKKKEETKQERKKPAENRYPYCKDETKKKENDP
jgi:hypothetical protein